jgi:hypothetical protein
MVPGPFQASRPCTIQIKMQIPSTPFRVIRLRGAANSILLLAAMALLPGCEKQPDMSLSKDQMPLIRGDYAIDLIMRIYVPDLEKLKTWKAPKAEKVKSQ